MISDLEISVPSFSTILPGLSSYMAFGLKDSLNNYLELSLRIKPQFIEQISLIAYIGQSNWKKSIPDYFAVTFVQGYLMLTWDLGSGNKEIVIYIYLQVGEFLNITLLFYQKMFDFVKSSEIEIRFKF